MADPVLTDHYKCQAILYGPTGLTDPTDRYMNNWYFRNDVLGGSRDTAANNIKARLDTFYTAIVGRYAAWLLDRIDYKIYDLGQAPPRDPINRTSAIAVGGSSSSMPAEVAAVLSFGGQGAPRTAGVSSKGKKIPSRRRTGRVFLGPLSIDAMVLNDTASGPPYLASVFLNEVRAQAQGLQSVSAANPVRWVLVSQQLDASYVVTDGWTDTEPDTVRRRGRRRPLGRQVWPG